MIVNNLVIVPKNIPKWAVHRGPSRRVYPSFFIIHERCRDLFSAPR